MRRLAFSVLIGNACGRTPLLSPAYDFVARPPYILGGSRGPSEITLDQARRFSGAARLPFKPAWDIVRETVERTAATKTS